ncbi:unnamed protein product, partial [Penicillium discolor]
PPRQPPTGALSERLGRVRGVGRPRRQTGASVHRLRGAHGDRQGLRDERTESTAPGHGHGQARGEQQQDRRGDPVRGEGAERIGGRALDVGVFVGRHVPDHARGLSEQGETERGVAHSGRVAVGEAAGDTVGGGEESIGTDVADLGERGHGARGRPWGRRAGGVLADRQLGEEVRAGGEEDHAVGRREQVRQSLVGERVGVGQGERAVLVEGGRCCHPGADDLDLDALIPEELGERQGAGVGPALRVERAPRTRTGRGELRSREGHGDHEHRDEDPSPQGRGATLRPLRGGVDGVVGRGGRRHAGTASGRWARSRSSVAARWR